MELTTKDMAFHSPEAKKAWENTNYFVPSIEDIRVGYEYETIKEISGPWVTEKFDWPENGFVEMALLLTSNRIRVPYLTKEQIEGEGWNFVNQSGARQDFEFESERGFKFKMGKWVPSKHGDIDIWAVGDNGEFYCWYKGECKDINTLRQLMKLLNIK